MRRPLIGEVLLENGIITQEQLNDALKIQEANGELIGTILINQNIISKETLIKYLSIQAETWLPNL